MQLFVAEMTEGYGLGFASKLIHFIQINISNVFNPLHNLSSARRSRRAPSFWSQQEPKNGGLKIFSFKDSKVD